MGLLKVFLGEEPDFLERLFHYEDKGQYGEYLTEYALEHNLFPKGRFALLKNLYLPADGKTTEIDLVMIHQRGIFVFESKNYSGWIFGDEEGLYWTQSLKGNVRNRFYNPIRQNANHIKYLAKYLDIAPERITSCIVFSERCELKSVPVKHLGLLVVKRNELLKSLRRLMDDMPICYSEDDIIQMGRRLKQLTERPEAEKQRHIEAIQTTCPFCGGRLVLRNGKYGSFYGCANYPKCRFTKKED
jgi:Zn-finger domain associated with topoisomerase type I